MRTHAAERSALVAAMVAIGLVVLRHQILLVVHGNVQVPISILFVTFTGQLSLSPSLPFCVPQLLDVSRERVTLCTRLHLLPQLRRLAMVPMFSTKNVPRPQP